MENLLKFLIEQLFDRKSRKVARLQRALDNYILVKKELTLGNKLDDRILQFADSIAFGQGQLIPKQYINFAEKTPTPHKAYELFSNVDNYLKYSLDNSFPAIKDKYSEEKERREFEKQFSRFSYLFFCIAFIGLVAALSSMVLESRSTSLLLSLAIRLTMLVCGTGFAILGTYGFFMSIVSVPNSMSALNQFEKLLEQATAVQESPNNNTHQK